MLQVLDLAPLGEHAVPHGFDGAAGDRAPGIDDLSGEGDDGLVNAVLLPEVEGRVHGVHDDHVAQQILGHAAVVVLVAYDVQRRADDAGMAVLDKGFGFDLARRFRDEGASVRRSLLLR